MNRLLVEDLQNGTGTELRANGRGEWRGSDGRARAEFAGCIDVDVSTTPFTNSLPVRRLELEPGDSAVIEVVMWPSSRRSGASEHSRGTPASRPVGALPDTSTSRSPRLSRRARRHRLFRRLGARWRQALDSGRSETGPRPGPAGHTLPSRRARS
ncbi:MAG: putative glycolipid-binding domain-containing protein [Actinobacteria bacterium]|nr:putative glycolipid-binding domain-containing protein [Actinomycetota bacterium]